MALRFASFLLCTLCAVGFGVAIPAPPPTGQCGQNSEYRTCGSPCAPTCANPFPGPLCVLPCVDACFCAKGYLKSANGTCVRPEQCEQVHDIPMQIPGMQLAVSEQNDEPHKECTSPNEEYRSCGPMCQPTCHTNKLTMFCSLRCNKGCFCKEGYIRDASNNCIPVSQCPQESNPIQVLAAEEEPKQCGDNEEYRNCGPFCQPTCNQRLPKRCSLRCKKGCFCKESYLRNQEGKCVPKSECEAVALPSVAGVALPLHGVTLRPGSGSLHKFTIPPASMPEQTGPISIPLEKVPLQANSPNNMEYLAVPQCPHPDEEFSVCGVQQDCMNACMHHPMKPQCMQRMCTPGCKCREPLVRRQDGVCVEKTQCSH